jgi:hypothetical protein
VLDVFKKPDIEEPAQMRSLPRNCEEMSAWVMILLRTRTPVLREISFEVKAGRGRVNRRIGS